MIMILEAIVKKARNTLQVETPSGETLTVDQKAEDDQYKSVCRSLIDGEKVFVELASKSRCYLVINFNGRNEEMFLQKMFGNAKPSKPTPYQKRMLKQITGYQH